MKILIVIVVLTLVVLGSSNIIAEPYNASSIRQREIAQLRRIETQREVVREYNSQKFYNRGMDRLYEQQLRANSYNRTISPPTQYKQIIINTGPDISDRDYRTTPNW